MQTLTWFLHVFAIQSSSLWQRLGHIQENRWWWCGIHLASSRDFTLGAKVATYTKIGLPERARLTQEDPPSKFNSWVFDKFWYNLRVWIGSKFQTTHTLKNSPNMNKIDYAGLLFCAPSVWKISLLGFDPSSHASCASLEKTDLLSERKPQTCNRKIVQSSLSRRGAAKIYNYSISYIFSMIWESPHTCHGKTTMGIGAEFGPSFFL